MGHGAGQSMAGQLEAARASVAGRAVWDSWASMAALHRGYVWSGSASDATYGTRAAGASGEVG
jgi:hypothetical protein